MPELCDSLLSVANVFDCDNPPIGGAEINMIAINRADIDIAVTTFLTSYEKEVMTNLTLKVGKKGYLFQGHKTSNNPGFELVKKEIGKDKFRHLLDAVIFNNSKDAKKSLNEFASGANIVLVVENVGKGAQNKDAFEVYGYHAGLEIQTATRRVNENEGTTAVTFSSVENKEEPFAPYLLLSTDYATTKSLFDGLLEVEDGE